MTLVKAALTRAGRTAAQAALAALGTGAFNIIDADWQAVAGLSAGAAAVSLLTSVAFPPPEATKA
ncbi:MAG: putative lactococcus lactis phage r1t holin [Acidimicrobiales bacterium]|nr:putative lactococcus lactis phage r1t holin [Acidimicrobiales bacterium]